MLSGAQTSLELASECVKIKHLSLCLCAAVMHFSQAGSVSDAFLYLKSGYGTSLLCNTVTQTFFLRLHNKGLLIL